MSGKMNLMANSQDGYAHHLTGSDKTLFKCSYRRPTDFGLQKFRYDPVNNVGLKLASETELNFTIDTNDAADLLLDTHLVVNLPDIWSPIHAESSTGNDNVWRPFEVRWVRNLGTAIISNVEIFIDNHKVQEHIDGLYMRNIVEREFSSEKKALYNEMVGNVPELYDPAAHHGGHYPHASHKDEAMRDSESEPLYEHRVEPSIRGRQLIIPIMGWYYFSTKQAVPLCCLRESGKKTMTITVTLRPLQEWYVLKCVDPYMMRQPAGPDGLREKFRPVHVDSHVKRRHVAPNYANESSISPHYRLNRFMKEPPSTQKWDMLHGGEVGDSVIYDAPNYKLPDLSRDYYNGPHSTTDYSNFDVHLVATKATLEPTERAEFLSSAKDYLFKQVVRISEFQVPLIHKMRLENFGHAANISIFLQRDDVVERNEHDNYTCQSYLGEREEPLSEPKEDEVYYLFKDKDPLTTSSREWDLRKSVGTLGEVDNLFRTTGKYMLQNNVNILRHFTFHFAGQGKERSEYFSHVQSSIDRFMRCGGGPKGAGGGGGRDSRYAHFYTFELDTSPFDATPSGYLNTESFDRVELEYTLTPPPRNMDYKFVTLCDANNQFQLVDMHKRDMYEFNYNMFIYVEKWQKIRFEPRDRSVTLLFK